MEEPAVTISEASSNIFADLGFSPEESAHLQIRADLMLDLRAYIEKQGWTPAEAARFLDEPQSTIEALLEGKIEQFETKQLITLLTKAGMQVKLEVVPPA